MITEFEQQDYADLYPEGLTIANAAISFAGIEDRVCQLAPEECQAVAPMAPSRQAGFSSGRYCAARAQVLLNLTPRAVPRKERVPGLAQRSLGQHHNTRIRLRLRAVCKETSIGIDLEALGRVHAGLYKTLFTEREVDSLKAYGPMADTIMFSAKEAGYKAIYPVGRKFVGFHEAEVVLDESHQSFSIRYIGDHEPNKALNTGHGRWAIAHGHVFTLFRLA